MGVGVGGGVGVDKDGATVKRKGGRERSGVGGRTGFRNCPSEHSCLRPTSGNTGVNSFFVNVNVVSDWWVGGAGGHGDVMARP